MHKTICCCTWQQIHIWQQGNWTEGCGVFITYYFRCFIIYECAAFVLLSVHLSFLNHHGFLLLLRRMLDFHLSSLNYFATHSSLTHNDCSAFTKQLIKWIDSTARSHFDGTDILHSCDNNVFHLLFTLVLLQHLLSLIIESPCPSQGFQPLYVLQVRFFVHFVQQSACYLFSWYLAFTENCRT